MNVVGIIEALSDMGTSKSCCGGGNSQQADRTLRAAHGLKTFAPVEHSNQPRPFLSRRNKDCITLFLKVNNKRLHICAMLNCAGRAFLGPAILYNYVNISARNRQHEAAETGSTTTTTPSS